MGENSLILNGIYIRIRELLKHIFEDYDGQIIYYREKNRKIHRRKSYD